MKKQPQVTEQTRANLRAAFWELYAARPIEKISVREITDRAGYNRATFYLYYHDVYEVLEEIESELLNGLSLLVNDRLMRGEKLDFTQHMGIILQLAQRYRGYFAVLIGEQGDPTFSRRFKEVVAPLLERFVLPAEGLTEAERHILLEFYLSGIVAAVSTWLSEDEPMSIDQLISLIVGEVLRV
ncbi:TetR/AcrR family transcriptional regulator [Olsenella profusa]|uniref:TetR/AcrR family transcriptional regulator C-terminal domain-containing protein n=1 Tax=Olsenella profusa TaxID=138595 RepID=A0ABS2F1A7_9ACTN|nr:TetR/AcrR family transcriptional regulator [Olsenella profusa]MBM6774342.1 TetR/AcrR family transcriptional regulator C-terminal domain-containing protein [Olsenella profusa]